MSNKENSIDDVINNTFEKIKSIIDANVIFGKSIRLYDNNMLIPVSKVNVGIVSGGGSGFKNKCENVASSAGFTLIPIGFISVINDVVNFISVNNSDTITQKLVENLFKLTEKIIDNNEVDNEN